MPNTLNVSCRALESYLSAFPDWDLKYSKEFGRTFIYLTTKSNFISWKEFTAFIDLFVHVHGMEKLRDAQYHSIRTQNISALRILGLLTSPKALYKLYTRWMEPITFPCLNTTFMPISESKIEIYLEMPKPHSPTFISAQKYFLEYLPTLIGYDKSNIEIITKGKNLSYIIELPRSRTLYSKLRRFWRILIGGKFIATEFSLQQDAIRSTFSKLEETRQHLTTTKHELLELREKYSLSLDGVNDGMWDWDLQKDQMFMSEKWLYIMGYNPDTNIINSAEDWFSHVSAPDLEGLKSAIEEHITGKSASLAYQFRIDAPRFQKQRWAFVKGKVVLDKNKKPYRMAGSLADITEFIDISQNLNNTIRSYHGVLQHSPDGALIYNEKEILSTNPAMLTFLGYEKEEALLGQPIRNLSDSFPRFFEPEIYNLKGDEDSIIPFIRKDGEIKEGEVSALKVQFEKKIVNCILVRDITSRRTLEQKLREIERVIAVGTMASGIAHEINNPMAYIQANVEFVKNELDDLDTYFKESPQLLARFEEMREALLDTLGGSVRVRTIVQDLKSLSHSSENETLKSIDIIPIIESSIAIIRKNLETKAALIIRLQNTPLALFSEGRLGQVVLNLLVNAVQAIPEGAPEKNEIRIRSEATEREVLIHICDSGNGIPEKIQKKIFDPFFTTKPAGEGTGLGLSICNNIMKRLGGDLSFKSKPGEGTTFTIHLPRAIDTTTRPTNPSTKYHILIVDDDDKIGSMMHRMLHPLYRITFVNSAIKALIEIEESDDIDLIICDAMMPEMSGYDLMDQLKSNRIDLLPRFILMTGGRLETQRFKKYEMTYHTPVIFKPFDREKIEETITACIKNPLHI